MNGLVVIYISGFSNLCALLFDIVEFGVCSNWYTITVHLRALLRYMKLWRVKQVLAFDVCQFRNCNKKVDVHSFPTSINKHIQQPSTQHNHPDKPLIASISTPHHMVPTQNQHPEGPSTHAFRARQCRSKHTDREAAQKYTQQWISNNKLNKHCQILWDTTNNTQITWETVERKRKD